MKALVLAAGAGKRFGKLTEDEPKALLPISGSPLVGWVLRGLDYAGIREVNMTVGYLGHLIENEFGNSYGNIKINYVENCEWGKGNLLSLLAAKDYLNERFLMCMSDHLFDPNIVKDLIAQESRKSVVLAVDKKLPNHEDTKVIAENNLIRDIGKNIKGNLTDTGFFCCYPTLFKYGNKAANLGQYELSDCIRLAAQNHDAEIMHIKNYFWKDIDTPEDIEILKNKLLKHRTKEVAYLNAIISHEV